MQFTVTSYKTPYCYDGEANHSLAAVDPPGQGAGALFIFLRGLRLVGSFPACWTYASRSRAARARRPSPLR